MTDSLGNFFGPSFNILLTNGSTPLDDRARINGLQIIANPVPEPSSLALAALGLAGLGLAVLLRRRGE